MSAKVLALVETLRFVLRDLNSELDYETRLIIQAAIDNAEADSHE